MALRMLEGIVDGLFWLTDSELYFHPSVADAEARPALICWAMVTPLLRKTAFSTGGLRESGLVTGNAVGGVR